MIVWPGLRRFISTVQRLFNSASFYAPLTHYLVLDRGTGSPTFTRATAATVLGYGPTANSGDSQTLLTVAANEARFVGARRISEGVWSDTFADGTPIPSSTLLGYLAEGARTNLCPYSQSIAAGFTFSGTCTGTDNVGIYAGIPFTRISNATGGASYSTISYTGNGTKAFSCLLKKDGAVTGTYSVGFYDNGASVVRGYVTATIAADGGMTFAANGGCTVTGSRELADGVWELQGTVAGIVASNANIYYANFAVGTATSCLVSAMQTENASFPSTYIATTTIAVARNADVLYYSAAGNTTDAAGWAYAEIYTPSYATDAVNAHVFVGFGNPTGMLNSGNRPVTQITSYDGTTIVEKTGLSSMQTATRKRGITWGGSTQLAAGDGATPASGAFDGGIGVSTNIYIGCNSSGTQQADAIMRNVRLGTRKLSSSEQQAITA